MRKSTHEAAASDALHSNLRELRRAGVAAEPAPGSTSYIVVRSNNGPLQLGSSKACRRFLANLARGGR